MKKRFLILWGGIWIVSALCVLLGVCIHFSENVILLKYDVCHLFEDNTRFLLHFFILEGGLFAFCLVVFIIALLTKEFAWTGIIGKKEFSVRSTDKSLSRVLLVFCIALACVFVYISGMFINLHMPLVRKALAPASWKGDQLVMHAGGGIDGVDYTNSRDAVENSYAQQAKTLEIDMLFTADDHVVCWHMWETPMNQNFTAEEQPLLYEEFMQQKVFDKYEPMSIETLIECMKEHEDLYIVTDTKYNDAENVEKEFRMIVDTAKKMQAEDVLDRMVVQLYNYEMYDYVEKVHHFKQYILTLYQTDGRSKNEFIQDCRHCKRKGIDIITMWDRWAKPEIRQIAWDYDLEIYVHTVNDIEAVKEWQDKGISGIYTDFIFPSMLE